MTPREGEDEAPRTIRLRFVVWIAGGIGLLIAIALLIRAGVPQVLQLLHLAGWMLLCLVPLRVAALALDAAGWRRLLGGAGASMSWWYLTWAAVVRESVAGLLPVARVGGELVGVRLLMRRGVPAPTAGGSVLVELTLTMLAQLLFAGVGLALLLSTSTAGSVPKLVALGLVLGVVALAAFVGLQHRWGLFHLIDRAFMAIAGRELLQVIGPQLDSAARRLYADRAALFSCVAWQLAGLFAGGVELWVTLHLLGQPTSARASLIVESLIMAAQSALFIVPGGVGTQEGGFVLIGAAVGLSPQAALALSLARRVRQFALGIPALISWYAVGP